ncbi:hypothetical protein [Nocardia seriolae]|uniref:Beta-ketoacyl synthase n=1 Tax=Nocardia seriolae TaxID=37332 RepID=A0ABC9YNN0_9NOCA|nr:hypothetical protein [Nocardia seriolae]APB00451.1 hypothetical protein NS506_06415 [Nocardia seriolae]OJF79252.1 hypothetical protein NS14008_08580 [Nocardia seriolae]WKY50709.1 hypothetical protein Q5P07_27450 [Nocardia seriolae]WNJ57352.1 hypothetical protein RMO66_28570 [Nocardia seriolae]BAW05411.1 conserved hypothetical protein [Nocardia seriolae]
MSSKNHKARTAFAALALAAALATAAGPAAADIPVQTPSAPAVAATGTGSSGSASGSGTGSSDAVAQTILNAVGYVPCPRLDSTHQNSLLASTVALLVSLATGTWYVSPGCPA